MQDACMQQVIKLKVSAFDLKDRHLSWVLLKKSLKIYQRPKLNQTITIKTYPTGFNKVLAYRDFKCFDQAENLLAESSSTWTLMNTSTKQMERIPDDILAIKIPAVEKLRLPRFKIDPKTITELVTNYTVQKFDLDWNKHLNNAQLIKIIFSNVDSPSSCKQFNISFKTETFEKDQIQVYQSESGDITNFKVWNETSGQIIALAQIIS